MKTTQRVDDALGHIVERHIVDVGHDGGAGRLQLRGRPGEIGLGFIDRGQMTRAVARGPVARLVASGGRQSHDWTEAKNALLVDFDNSGITAVTMNFGPFDKFIILNQTNKFFPADEVIISALNLSNPWRSGCQADRVP